MEYLGGGSALDLVRRFNFFIQLAKFYTNLAKWQFLYLRSKILSPSFHIFLIYFLISFPLLSYAQGPLKRLTLLQY